MRHVKTKQRAQTISTWRDTVESMTMYGDGDVSIDYMARSQKFKVMVCYSKGCPVGKGLRVEYEDDLVSRLQERYMEAGALARIAS